MKALRGAKCHMIRGWDRAASHGLFALRREPYLCNGYRMESYPYARSPRHLDSPRFHFSVDIFRQMTFMFQEGRKSL